jgi:hypothetical protein
MKVSKDFEEFFESLNKNEVNYLVVGGYAYAIHAEPRFTKDLDIFIQREEKNASALLNALNEFGMELEGLEKSDFLIPDQVVQLGYPPFRIDLLTSISGVEFEIAWKNKVTGRYGDEQVYFIGKEDLIKNKKSSGRKSDLDDLDRLGQDV